MANILVVAAHPDDEVLGCGGAIARHAAEGDRVRVVIVAEGLTSRGPVTERSLDALHTAAHKAGEIFGVSEVHLEGLPDNRLDSIDRLAVIQRIEAHMASWKPSVVYTHHVGDVNIDHQVVHHAVVTACRPQSGQHCVERLLFFEVASSTEWQTPGSGTPFQPNWFIDISPYLGAKLKALEAYGGEILNWPHPRSVEGVEHLGRWRGSAIGVEAAEAFMLGRQIGRIPTGYVGT
jgi:LmbE family N-acetylglucosaminyl deacetylase